MPELPEVETVVRGLAARMAGRRIARLELHRGDLRSALPAGLAAKVEGRRIERVIRRAKYILIHLADGGVMLLHLGMSGRLVVMDPGASPPRGRHDHVTFILDDRTVIRFNDPRRFGTLDYTRSDALGRHPLLAHLGPEPLDDGFDGPTLAGLLADKRTPIKAALLDQRVVAGLGNIYVCESLFQAGISPRRLASTVTGTRAARLALAIRDVLRRAIEAGGSSIRDYVQVSGELGYFQHHWAVYGRAGEACPGCDCTKTIKRIVQNNRSTFYCAKRQR
jgi:formamidopyrimidine-DNA glycosylase